MDADTGARVAGYLDAVRWLRGVDAVTVQFVTTVTIDRDAWQRNYGMPSGEVSRDVAGYLQKFITSAVRDHLDATGNEGTVDVREGVTGLQPSDEGRSNLAADVMVCAHHSSVHDGVNVEIDAPAGTRITVHLNDGDLVDVVVPS